jgi:MarR family transcriptional regulator, organic hydroperoxide resistance regulator
MSALQDFLALHLAQAAVRARLDEELGTQHGLAWADFALLAVLEGGGAFATGELARRMGLTGSALVLQLLPLEKVGLVERQRDAAGTRRVLLRPHGARLLREARETAETVCASAPAASLRAPAAY